MGTILDLTDERGSTVTPLKVVVFAAAVGALLITAGVALLGGLAWALICSGVLVITGTVTSLLDIGDIP